MQVNKYEDITFDMLGTRRQRPMYLSKFTKFKSSLDMKTYPKDPHAYTEYFLKEIDQWVNLHQFVKYIGLSSLPHRHSILGTTHQLDELHQLYGKRITTYIGEYKYHRRLTDFKVKQINHYSELAVGDVFIASYPSCITTGYHKDFNLLLDHCLINKIPVHIDGAWFGQCRNFEFDVTHPAIALKGRVPIKVYGTVKKGDLLTTSPYAGHAEVAGDNVRDSAIIGIALASNETGPAVIEVMIK